MARAAAPTICLFLRVASCYPGNDSRGVITRGTARESVYLLNLMVLAYANALLYKRAVHAHREQNVPKNDDLEYRLGNLIFLKH